MVLCDFQARSVQYVRKNLEVTAIWNLMVCVISCFCVVETSILQMQCYLWCGSKTEQRDEEEKLCQSCYRNNKMMGKFVVCKIGVYTCKIQLHFTQALLSGLIKMEVWQTWMLLRNGIVIKWLRPILWLASVTIIKLDNEERYWELRKSLPGLGRCAAVGCKLAAGESMPELSSALLG